MRKYLLAGVAALVVAAPAAATNDNAGYVGLEGGILFPKSQTIFGTVDFTGTPTDFARTDVGSLRYKKGLDLDFIGGYDFGMFRVEKAGIVHAGIGKASFSEADLVENFRAFMDAIIRNKPSGAKGKFVQKVSVSSTMGPGVKVDLEEIAGA